MVTALVAAEFFTAFVNAVTADGGGPTTGKNTTPGEGGWDGVVASVVAANALEFEMVEFAALRVVAFVVGFTPFGAELVKSGWIVFWEVVISLPMLASGRNPSPILLDVHADSKINMASAKGKLNGFR